MTLIQEQLEDLAAQIGQGRDDVDVPGLGGLSLDVEGRGMDVYWVGDPTSHVQQLVDQPPTGVSLRVHPAAYDVATVVEAITKLESRYGEYIQAISPSSERVGTAGRAERRRNRQGSNGRSDGDVAGIPGTTELTDPPEPVAGESPAS